MKRLGLALLGALVGLFLTAANPLQNQVVVVANLTALQTTPIRAAYGGAVERMTDGVAGAPPMGFLPGAGTCTSASLNNDGASCVNDNSGNHWLGLFPATGADVRQWGAVSGGTTDASAALQAAFSSGVTTLLVPALSFRSSTQLALADGVTLLGASYQFNATGVGGSLIQCDATVANACLAVGAGDNASNVVQDLTITHGTGTLASTAECLSIPGGAYVYVTRVRCYNSVNGFEADATPATGTGIYNYFSDISTCKVSGSHVIVNSTPGVYFDHPALGCDGAFDVTGAAFVKVTGNWDTTKGTIHFVDPHFNLGQNTVGCAFNFAGFTGSTNQLLDFVVTGGHVETATSFLCSDNSVNSIAQMVIQGNSSTGGTHFFALNVVTEPEFWSFANNTMLGWTDFTLNPNVGPSAVNISGNQFPALLSITANSIGDAVITDNNYLGGVTLAGTGWVGGQFSGTFLAGATSISNSALSTMNVQLSNIACTPTLQIGGSSTGITYLATPNCMASLSNHYLTMSFLMNVTSLGGLTGSATMVGLPFESAAYGTPLTPLIYSNMASLSGGLEAEVGVSGHTILFGTPGSTAVAGVTNSNFGSCSSGTPCAIQGTVTYPIQGN